MRLTLLALLLCLAACGKEAPDLGPAKALEAVSRSFAETRARGDTAALVEMTKAMLPTAEELRKILRTGPAADAFLTKYDAVAFRAHAEGASRELLMPSSPAQTVVKVHMATTEELADPKKGTPAYDAFPGGMRRFAQVAAAPGRLWMKIEYLEPGKDLGMSFSCFTVLDGKVIFLIKPWRFIPREEKPAAAPGTDPKPESSDSPDK